MDKISTNCKLYFLIAPKPNEIEKNFLTICDTQYFKRYLRLPLMDWKMRCYFWSHSTWWFMGFDSESYFTWHRNMKFKGEKQTSSKYLSSKIRKACCTAVLLIASRKQMSNNYAPCFNRTYFVLITFFAGSNFWIPNLLDMR